MSSHPRLIPSIEQLRQRPSVQRLEARYGRDATVQALRDEAAALRRQLAAEEAGVRDAAEAAARIEAGLAPRLDVALSPSLRPVINATGVIVHTNLGRAPLARAAVERIAAAAGYSNLEYDLARGERGSRAVHARALLQHLTGAEDAAVVNNNAAAVLLTLAALAAGREVIVSRGELVEIGDGFRIPDVLRQSGAQLREVGTTNRTRAADYAAAVNDRTALILRVHPSNFRIEGFAERPPLAALADIGRRFDLPVVEDLGSGNLLARPGRTGGGRQWDEPTVGASLQAGCAVCCFSGDKLLGGPQAGLIVGRAAQLEPIRRHPLMRAVRADKLTYAALEGTLLEYATGRAGRTVPVAAMIGAEVESLRVRARQIAAQLAEVAGLEVAVTEGDAVPGGGAAPGLNIPSCLLDVRLEDRSPGELESLLRRAEPPVIGRIEQDRLLLDLRTVQPDEDATLADVLEQLAAEPATRKPSAADTPRSGASPRRGPTTRAPRRSRAGRSG